jgi:hypothetical protein
MGDEYLTWAQIEAKYPNEWVLIDRPRYRRKWEDLLGGHVVWHAADRDEFDRRLLDFQEVGDCAILYTGKPDPDEVFLLNYNL